MVLNCEAKGSQSSQYFAGRETANGGLVNKAAMRQTLSQDAGHRADAGDAIIGDA